MKIDSCSFEDSIRHAFSTEEWTVELRDHLIDCDACSDLLLVNSYLSQVEDKVVDDAPLLDPRVLWRRAQLEQRLQASRKATLPIVVVSWIAGLCGVGAALTGLFFFMPSLRRSLSSLASLWSFDAMPSTIGNPTIVLIASAVVLLM
ncbi:MAG: hypothetical protein GY906_21480, partial [bacterium]|nr:hypothetical protein [bacterium]